MYQRRRKDNKGIIIRAVALILTLLMIMTSFSKIITNAETKSKKSFTVSVVAGAMQPGDTKKITVSPKNVKVKSYKSSNKKVLKVNSKGKLKALKKGTATVTVTAKNGQKSSIVIKVFGKNSDIIVDRKINGKKGLWHIKSGKVVKKTGFATDGIDWYYTQKGKVSKKTGIIKGKVNGENAQWYVKKGKVQLSCSDYIYDKGYTYKVVNGKAGKKAKGKLDAFFDEEICLSENETKVIGEEKISFRVDAIYESGNVGCTFIEDGKESEVILEVDGDSKNVLYTKFIKDYKIDFIKIENRKVYIKISKKNTEIKKPMAISGQAGDHYTTTDYEYIESDNLIIFMPKGISFDGNILVKFEEYMKSVEKNTGLQRKQIESNYVGFQVMQKYVYGTDVFEGVDSEYKKVHVYINDNIHPNCSAVREGYSAIIMDSYALKVNDPDKLETTFIHEYTHYNHLTNGTSFNPIMNEGYAAYIEMKAAREFVKVSDEDFHYNYLYGYLMDEGELTEANAEKIFTEGYPDGPEHTKTYNYGYVFMEYLHQTYGSKAFTNLFKEGNKILDKQVEETGMGDLSGENTAKLLKKTYSNNIFKDFVKWIGEHPEYTREAQVYE